MSQGDQGENILSGTEVEQEDAANLKLVPVSESIRYRKRAQAAEKENERLASELEDISGKATSVSEELKNAKSDQELMLKLSEAGAIDVETSVLVAKSRLKDDEDIDLDELISELKKEKGYLFGSEEKVSGVGMTRTSGVKDRIGNQQAALLRAAAKAATTGSRVDLVEYLKLRRNCI